MYRSNHFDHNTHMKNVSPNLKWINELFNEIQFLVTSYNSDKEKDCKIALSWLIKVHQHFTDTEFNTLTMARYLDDLSRITSNHPVLKTCIIKYIKDHHKFREDLFDKTYDLLLDSKPRELCHILGGLSRLEMVLPDEWWSRWFSSSAGNMGSFNAQDIRQSIRACARFHKKPPQEWCDSWSLRCSVHIDEFLKELDTFSKILSAVGHLKITIDRALLDVLIDNTRIFLTSLTKDEELILVSKAFGLEEVCKEKRLVSDWFKHSYNKINGLHKRELEALCIAFFYVGKLDENVSLEWIDRCIEKITDDFEYLSVKAIINALYAMALFQMEVKQVRTFLEKCMLLFKMERNNIFNENFDIFWFKKIMISSYYFKTKSFDLGLNINDYPKLLNAAKIKEKNDPSKGEKRVLATLEELSIKNVEKEYWVNEIMDAVDFYVPDVQKLIEFDGKYHETNGMINRLTKLKTFILQSYGYTLIRIDYKEKSTMNDILLRELSFFEPNHTLSRENIIPDKVCELNVFETFNLGDLNTGKKEKLSEDVYKKWMDEIGCMFKTCSVSHFNSLLIQFSLLVESNGRVKYAFYTYARKDPDFLTMVLTRSLEKADHYSPHELIELLHNWVRLSIKPTKEWCDHWCMLCLKNTKEFNIFNFEATFNYFHILKIDFSDRWVECFFNYTRSLLSTLKVSELCELAHCCVYHRLDIPELWAAELKHELLPVLPTMRDKTLFELPKLFSIKELKEDRSFLLKWFAQTSSVMKEVESTLLIDTFYQLAKFNIKVTDQWMSNFQERILEMFSALDMADVTRILYGLALMEEKVEKIKPILDACQKYFFNRESAIFQTSNIDVFYNTMRAINYFERSGYKFVINVKNCEEINNIIFPEETLSPLKETLEVYIKAHYFPNIKRRAKKDFLLKYVDFVDVSHNLVIEIERGNKPAKSHMIDILLRQEGYVCIRLCYHKIKQDGNAYVDEEILNYFKNYNIDFKTVEDMKELKRV